MRTIEWPFRGAEAVDSGSLTYRELRRFHAGIYPGVWIPREVELTAVQRARAAWLWSGRSGVLAGLSASAMLGGRWIDGETPAELIHGNRRPPTGIVVHSDDLDPWEVQTVGGMAVTTAARTGFDLGRRLPLTEGVPCIDALLNATHAKVADIEHILAARPGARGVRQLRQTLALVDGGAESPYESMTRLLLLQKGFPRPETQIVVRDDNGQVFARIDLGWRQWCVGVDFEGKHHWTDPRQRDWDIERYARLPELNWIDVRLTARVLHQEPERFLDRVGVALISRGCPKSW